MAEMGLRIRSRRGDEATGPKDTDMAQTDDMTLSLEQIEALEECIGFAQEQTAGLYHTAHARGMPCEKEGFVRAINRLRLARSATVILRKLYNT